MEELLKNSAIVSQIFGQPVLTGLAAIGVILWLFQEVIKVRKELKGMRTTVSTSVTELAKELASAKGKISKDAYRQLEDHLKDLIARSKIEHRIETARVRILCAFVGGVSITIARYLFKDITGLSAYRGYDNYQVDHFAWTYPIGLLVFPTVSALCSWLFLAREHPKSYYFVAGIFFGLAVPFLVFTFHDFFVGGVR